MVNALGGKEAVLALPELKDWKGDLNVSHMTAPIMKGTFKNGSPFLLFSFLQFDPDQQKFTTKAEYLGLKGNSWDLTPNGNDQMSLKMNQERSPLMLHSREEYYMCDRIRRVVKGEPVGLLTIYPNNRYEKPANIEEMELPENAYLEGDALKEYMRFKNFYYERKCPKGFTDLFLCDPTKNSQEGFETLSKKNPEWEKSVLKSGAISIPFPEPIKNLFQLLLPKGKYPQGVDSLSPYPFILGHGKSFESDRMKIPIMKALHHVKGSMILIKMSRKIPVDSVTKTEKIEHYYLTLIEEKENFEMVNFLEEVEENYVWAGHSKDSDFLKGPFTDKEGNLLEDRKDSFTRLQTLIKEGRAEDDKGVVHELYKRFT